MNYSINKFFNEKECQNIIDFCLKNGEEFSYYEIEKYSWDCKRIYDENFKKDLFEKINNLYTNNQIKFWFDYKDFNVRNINVSLTSYYDGRRLDLHLDKTSNYTTVIPLTENYVDGRFCLSNSQTDLDNSTIKLELKLGEGITFEGNKTYHGVMPVFNGLRRALNIWMNDTDFKYYKLDTEKKLL